MNFPDYKIVQVSDLIPYARNSRTHSDAQIAKLASSIKEYGFLNPVIIDGENGIIAGHGRVMAAQKLGIDSLPCIEAKHLTDAQRRAYVIADNRMALDAGWDDELLRVELDELRDAGFDLSLTGFDLDEIEGLYLDEDSVSDDGLAENYSRKIEAPIYEITGECPSVSDLINREKTDKLQAEIEKAELPDDVRQFLHFAAERHTVFNFRNIAEFYAHADENVQELMEQSALIIIDFNRAIEDGFVRLTEAVATQYAKDYPDA